MLARRFALQHGESASHARGHLPARPDFAAAPSAVLAIVAATLLYPARVAAQACCGGTPQGGLVAVTRLPAKAGTVVTSLDWELRRLDTPARTSGPALAPLLHQRATMQLYTVAGEVSLSSWAAAAVVLPFAVNHQSISLPNGRNLSGTAAGIGDATFVGKLRVLAPGGSRLIPTVIVVGGVRAPTGPSTLESQQIGIYSPAFQPGTGAWGGLLGVSAVQPLTGPFSQRPWNLYGNAIGSYYRTNSLGYRLGPSVSYGLGVAVLLWHTLGVQAGIAGSVVAADHLKARSVDSTGSHQIWLAPSVTWTIVPQVSVYAGPRFSIWRTLKGTQLVGAYSGVAGVQLSFSAWGG